MRMKKLLALAMSAIMGFRNSDWLWFIKEQQ